MLILTRKPGQSIVIAGGIRLTVLAVEGERVRVGIEAPAGVQVLRSELVQAVEDENQTAVTLAADRNSVVRVLRGLGGPSTP